MLVGRLAELLIDDATWSRGSTVRRHEWRLVINEILQEGRFELPAAADGARALVTVGPTKIWFDVRAPGGASVVQCELPLSVMRPHIDEYLATIVEMSKLSTSANSPRLEALDIAKRITHDEAGETVVSLMGELKPDHGTARRLFTLFVTLLHDTTRLVGPHVQPH